MPLNQEESLYAAAPFPNNASQQGLGTANQYPQFASTTFSFAGLGLGEDQYPIEQMEVPWAEHFAWPDDAMGQAGGHASQFSHQGQHRIEKPSLLTPEDIAALMRINPGGTPFI